LHGNQARAVAGLGATAPAAGVSAGGVLAAEAVGTFALVLVTVAVATDTRVPRGIAALAIGAALAVAIVISGPVSGAGVNPDRAIGPMIVAGQLSDWWAYLSAPWPAAWRLSPSTTGSCGPAARLPSNIARINGRASLERDGVELGVFPLSEYCWLTGNMDWLM
jgi:Major intrinsic protein